MVCPNCKSDEIIAVQNQHFCISCGQMVPEAVVAAAAKLAAPAAPAVKVQSNGLPEGVEILPLAAAGPTAAPEASAPTMPAAAPVVPVASAVEAPASPAASPAIALIHGRSRIGDTHEATPAVVKRRKPGRPKSGRLDVPAEIAPISTEAKVAAITEAAIAAVETAAAMKKPAKRAARSSAKLPRSPLPTTAAPAGLRRMSDLAPRRPAASVPAAAPEPATPIVPVAKPAKPKKPAARPKRHAHTVGVPALHYGPVLAFSLRARVRPRWIVLAAFGAVSLGAAGAYGVGLLLAGGLPRLTSGLLQAGPKLLGGALVLLSVYYIGRSLGQAAITYGMAREADSRPVTLGRQLGVAINTFGRRLRLDLGFALAELVLLVAAVALFRTGGDPWPVNSDYQIGSIFLAFLSLLYLWVGLAIARGLAGVNLTLTKSGPGAAALLGWRLFSHRLELIGPRLGAIMIEAVLTLPLIVLVIALVISTPPAWHTAATVAAGVLAWLAGALLGVGTAGWWTMLYRALVTADRPDAAMALLSSRQPEDAHRLPLILIVILSVLVLAAGLILPWLSLF